MKILDKTTWLKIVNSAETKSEGKMGPIIQGFFNIEKILRKNSYTDWKMLSNRRDLGDYPPEETGRGKRRNMINLEPTVLI